MTLRNRFAMWLLNVARAVAFAAGYRQVDYPRLGRLLYTLAIQIGRAHFFAATEELKQKLQAEFNRKLAETGKAPSALTGTDP